MQSCPLPTSAPPQQFQHRSGALCNLLAYTTWTHSFTLLHLERLQGGFYGNNRQGKKKHMIKKQMFGGSLDKKNPIPPPLTSPFLLTLCQQLPHHTCPRG